MAHSDVNTVSRHAGKRLLSILVAMTMLGSALLVAAPFTGAAPLAVFVPPHSDHGQDENGNGLYDALVVNAVVEAYADGWYWVEGDLYDSLSNLVDIDGSFTIYLLTGINDVEFSFSWQAIYANGVDGPYTVSMTVSDESRAVLDSDSHTTNPYSVADFEFAMFSPPYSDYGDDKDGNGFYDALMFDFGVNVSAEGWFWVDATLYDTYYNEIGSTSVNAFLVQGLNTVTVGCPGIFISSNGVDGPYYGYAYLSDETDSITLDSDIQTTAAYLYTDFEYAYFSGPHSDYGADLDSNGYYDELVIDLLIDSSSEGWFGVSAVLYDYDGNEIESQSETAYLMAEENTVSVHFNGLYISCDGYDGPFNVDLTLTHSGSGRTLDTDYYETSGYSLYDFDYVVFYPPHVDYGYDSNSNGLFDDLIIGAQLELSGQGLFHVYGSLYDSYSYNIGVASAHVDLLPGINEVTLAFSGLDIFLNGVDGPYYVDMQVQDETGRWLAGDMHSTDSYLYTDFEQPGASYSPPYSDWGVDSDMNGFYDELDVNVSVSVTTEGWYQVRAALYDGSDGYIESQGWYSVYLTMGLSSGAFQFPWVGIFTHGVDGPYYVVLELMDEQGRYLDSDIYWTGSYLVSDFENAALTPPHSDYGNDTNSNVMFDELVVDVSIDVSMDAWYWLQGTLRDGNGTYIGYNEVRVHLNSGANTIGLAFDGIQIRLSGLDGPYTVSLVLFDDSHNWLDSDSHVTQAYLCTEFEYVPPGATFAPPHSDHGNDTNSNGFYEQLIVDISVDVATSGWFHLTGEIYDKFRQTIQTTSVEVFLETGSRVATLEFSGRMISHNAVEGPYHVDLDLYDDNMSLCDEGTYLTGSYSAGDFEYAIFSPPHSDYGADTNSNGYYDQLVIDAMVDVSSAGWYRVRCDLYDNMSGFIATNQVLAYLLGGAESVQVTIPWQSIFFHDIDGPYVAELSLYDESWGWLDDDILVTQGYLTSEFEHVMFEPPHSDHGVDENTNGLYESLVVDLQIDSTIEGWYWIITDVYDGLGGWVMGSTMNHVYLSAGVNSVPISFSWENFMSHGVDGPYTIDLTLEDDTYVWLDSDTYVTNEYFVTDFEAAYFSPPHSDYGVDDNANGLYDYLVLDSMVTVTGDGWYQVFSQLYDSGTALVDSVTETAFLTAGMNTVSLAFSGIDIFNNGVDGPYYVQMSLSDAVTSLDTEVHTTAAYLYTEFEQPSHFEPPHSDHGSDTDSNGLYDELVVDAVVNAVNEGWYYVYSELEDAYSGYIDSTGIQHVYLMEGLNSVVFTYSWKSIFSHGTDGPFTVNMYLLDNASSPLNSDSYITNSYMLSEFEHAIYSPPHSDYGSDTNGNSLFDELVVEASIEVTSADWYWVSAQLSDGLEVPIQYDGWHNVYLPAGSNIFEFSFSGIEIYDHGADGPYTLEMVLMDYYPIGHVLDTGSYTTSPYNFTDFEQLPHFVPPHSDHGQDTNMNGYYDELVVEAEVSVTSEGWYRVDGHLSDQNSSWIDDAETNEYLMAGMNTVSLTFSGVDIFINGADGPYVVFMELSDSMNYYDSDTYSTGAYAYTDFEPLGVMFTPPHSDYGTDTDGNGLYNNLIVEASVTVIGDGWYTVDCMLTDNSSNQIEGISSYLFLGAGSNIVTFTFPWENIFIHGVNGPYNANLQVSIWDSGWRLLDSDTHITNAYNVSDFEYAILSPPHADQAIDLNGNGQFDELVVDVEVSVSVEGWYQVRGELYDNASGFINSQTSLAYLSSGTSTVQVAFLGTSIYSNGADGPYTANLVLMDNLPMPFMHTFVTGMHTTSAYSSSSFEGAYLSSPHSDHAEDTNSNSLYDKLEVDASVTVSSDGWFWLSAFLYDNSSTMIQYIDVNVYLFAGVNSVPLNFTGTFISSNGVNGPYIVSMTLSDSSWRLMDTDLHLTGSYNASDFEFAAFSPPHSDHGVDTDSNGLYDYLAVNVSVSVSSDGWYYVYANLEDNASGWIDGRSVYVNLLAGTNVVELTFSWQGICRHAVDGPYTVVITLVEETVLKTLDSDVHVTAAYNYTDFESAYLAPPHSDHGQDSDGNGLYDELIVAANVYVSAEGWYMTYGALYDEFNSMIDSTVTNAYLYVGMNSVDLVYNWKNLYYHGVDGPYIVYLDLYDEASAFLGSDTYLTGSYVISEFESAAFTPPHFDFAVDPDGNGLFDALVVQANVTVTFEGWYRVAGSLYDDLSNEIDTTSVDLYLMPGVSNFTLVFGGAYIAHNGLDGPYVVELLLTDESYRWLDSGTYITAAYSASQFEPAVFSPPHWEYITDTNGDGYYDEFVLEVHVSIAIAGDYTIEGTLCDLVLNPIVSDSYTASFSEGSYTVTLIFDGLAISEREISGPYDIELNLSFAAGVVIDHNSHITGSYDWTLFERGFMLHLQPGWNFVTIPLIGCHYWASTLGLATGDEVASWNPAAQAYDQDYLVGLSPPTADFELLTGVGYWIYAYSNEDVLLVGGTPTSFTVTPITVPAEGGWVMIGLCSLNEGMMASSLPPMYAGGLITDIARWNYSTQSYDVYIVGVDPSYYDFGLNPGEAYWIWVTAPGALFYSP